MKKIRMDRRALEVESFEVLPADEAGLGTVGAHAASWDPPTCRSMCPQQASYCDDTCYCGVTYNCETVRRCPV